MSQSIGSLWIPIEECPCLMSSSVSVALPAISSLHLGQMHGERLDLGELMEVLWCPVMCPAVD